MLTIILLVDPGEFMLRQVKHGLVDAITGDYLAGMCLNIIGYRYFQFARKFVTKQIYRDQFGPQ